MALCEIAAASDPATPRLSEITKRLSTGDALVFATFGDSITWPCYHTDFRQNYVTLTIDSLRKEYPNANVRIVHAGNMGTAARGLADGRYQRHVLDHRPDVVFLMFGMNDCAAGPAGLVEFDDALTELIAQARTAGARPVVLTQNEILYDSPDGARRTSLSLYAQRAMEAARRAGVPAVDCFSDWQPIARSRPDLIARLNDWIHPNLAGHRLFARTIVATLWPEATQHVETEIRPQPPLGDTACLLPGPAGKQVLRTSEGIWFTLTGRRRGDRISDLVVSFSESQRPGWDEFTHVTLIGPGADALFPDHDRAITAALLHANEGVLSILFSWNTGVHELQMDLDREGWRETIRQPSSWKELEADPFLRPTPVLNSRLGNGLLYDGAAGRKASVVLCRDRMLAEGSGYEILDGEDGVSWALHNPSESQQIQATFFAGTAGGCCSYSASGDFFRVLQHVPDGSIEIGQAGSPQTVTPLEGEFTLAMPWLIDRGYVLATPVPDPANDAVRKPVALIWSVSTDVLRSPVNLRSITLQSLRPEDAAFPALRDGRPALVLVKRGDDGRPSPVAYESLPPPGSESAGALIGDGDAIEFRQLSMQDIAFD